MTTRVFAAIGVAVILWGAWTYCRTHLDRMNEREGGSLYA